MLPYTWKWVHDSYTHCCHWQPIKFSKRDIAAVAQSDRVFFLHAEGWAVETQLQQTRVVKTGSDSPTAECSSTSGCVTGPLR